PHHGAGEPMRIGDDQDVPALTDGGTGRVPGEPETDDGRASIAPEAPRGSRKRKRVEGEPLPHLPADLLPEAVQDVAAADEILPFLRDLAKSRTAADLDQEHAQKLIPHLADMTTQLRTRLDGAVAGGQVDEARANPMEAVGQMVAILGLLPARLENARLL